MTVSVESTRESPLLVRLLAGLVVVLMAAATLYTAWIAVANFGRIGV
jgi:hypothetical protein